MKRICTLFLTLALLFSLAACGNGGQGAVTPSPTVPGDSTPNTPEQSLTDTESPAPSDSQQPDPSESTDPSGSQAPDSDQPPVVGNSSVPTPEQSSPTLPSQVTVPVTPPAQSQAPTAQTPPAASAPPVQATPEPAGPKILIAYFTWADNTVVDDPSAVDVDATTSASVLAPGNAAKMAGWIQQEVGGDLHSITVAEPYSSDYDECLDRAADEKADNARPALTSSVNHFEDYDIVFLGFPNWWYTLPMPVLSFMEQYDWFGKTVVPFVTHGTGGLASTMRDLDAALPDDVTRLEPIGVYRPEVDASQSTVREWAAGLDLGE